MHHDCTDESRHHDPNIISFLNSASSCVSNPIAEDNDCNANLYDKEKHRSCQNVLSKLSEGGISQIMHVCYSMIQSAELFYLSTKLVFSFNELELLGLCRSLRLL